MSLGRVIWVQLGPIRETGVMKCGGETTSSFEECWTIFVPPRET
jgi:hypothetical protein